MQYKLLHGNKFKNRNLFNIDIYSLCVLEKRKYNIIYQICEIDDCKIFFESKNINNIFFAHYLES